MNVHLLYVYSELVISYIKLFEHKKQCHDHKPLVVTTMSRDSSSKLIDYPTLSTKYIILVYKHMHVYDKSSSVNL